MVTTTETRAKKSTFAKSSKSDPFAIDNTHSMMLGVEISIPRIIRRMYNPVL